MENYISFVVLFAAVALLLVFIRRSTGAASKDQYDERQLLNQGKAFRAAFISVMAISAAYYYFSSVTDLDIMEDGVVALFIVCIGIVIFSVYAILTDCFFGFNGRMQGSVHPLFYMLILLIVVVIHVIQSVRGISEHEIAKDGILTHQCGGLVLAATFLIVLITMFIKYLIDHRDAGRE